MSETFEQKCERNARVQARVVREEVERARGMEARSGETEGLDPEGATARSRRDAPKETGEAVPASPLTDEQLTRIFLEATGEPDYSTLIARAIERACAEKWGVKLGDTGTTKEPA